MTAFSERQLDDAVRRLPPSIEPARDLWPGIEARMLSRAAQAKRARVTGIWRMAAGLALVGAAALLAVLAMRAPGNGEYPVASVPAAEIEYLQVRGKLTADLDQRLDELAPETRQVVEENLASIERSIYDIAKALDANPNNLLLRRLLYATYEQELSLLGTINRVTDIESNEGLEI